MKKNIFFIGASICLLVLLGVGLSYSMWNMSISQNTNNVIATTNECFDITLTNQSNIINLENAYPISDTKGKTLTPFTFTVKNTCDMFASYSVSLESLKGSTLSSEFLKVMVNDNEPKILNTLDSTDTVNSGSIESRILAKGSLSKNSSKDYSVRLWIDYDTTLEDLDNEIKILKLKIIIKASPQGYTGETVFNFDYTGGEQVFTVPVSGTYKLETWGAQGGDGYTGGAIGGYGGFSDGHISLKKDTTLYVNVGGQGLSNQSTKTNLSDYGGYNGGGNSSNAYFNKIVSGGGGATHISLVKGLLKNLESAKVKIYIVAGGGGGTAYENSYPSNGGNAGGIKGNAGNTSRKDEWCESHPSQCVPGIGGTQTSGDKSYFGQGTNSGDGAGGGAGYYGGTEGAALSGGGGSGYIGNSLLKNKAMYCYNCQESNEENTKTISTTCTSATPTENCAKKGNGYARITLISIDE